MRRMKKSIGLALLVTAASAITACFGKKDGTDANTVLFWSSFGGSYTDVLNGITAKAAEQTGVSIEHVSQKSYDNILSEMTSAIAMEDYPNLAMGYPDHFATYLAADILRPIQSYLTSDILSDYYPEYMSENEFYNYDGTSKEYYALPFNKSTELLGYNGVFVDYCAEVLGEEYRTPPQTWAEWETKGPQYNAILQELTANSRTLYAIQDNDGTAHDFSFAPAEGKKKLLEFSSENLSQIKLMSWDATDNAFITLVRQWGGEYTTLPASEMSNPIKRRKGHVRFTAPDVQPTVIECLKFFNRLNKQGIFGVPAELGDSYSSEAFAKNKVMFMVCSSGGLSYNNTGDAWNRRFRVAPIPYKDASHKYVISQGANICMTDKGNADDNFKVMRALTSGELQTAWCLETGYYPCSKSAAESQAYRDFLSEEKYPAQGVTATRVAYREGSVVNSDHYMNRAEAWNKFVDPAFVGSSLIRDAVENLFRNVFSEISAGEIEDDSQYIAEIRAVFTSKIKTSNTIEVEGKWWE